MSRKHNKSGSDNLSILRLDEYHLDECKILLEKTYLACQGRSVHSGCILLKQKDGRLTLNGKKVCYGYELVALIKFGKEKLKEVPPNKFANSLTISHLCGTRNCCNSQHIVLEPKVINDERVHCHYCMAKAYEYGGIDSVNTFKLIGCCQHSPICL